MLSKIQRTTQEFIKQGRLHEYSDEVTSIIKKIDNDGCAISCHYIRKKSSFCFELTGPLIRIEMLDRDVPLLIIWDILHEYGHFLSGPTEKQGPDLNRELLAWKFAEKELEAYPRLKALPASFNDYKEHCLEDYRKLDALGRK